MILDERTYDPDPPSREMAERLLRSGNVDTICGTLTLLTWSYADVHTGGEWAWLGTACLQFLKDARPSVRASAAQCLAYLVRSHSAMLRGPAPAALEQLCSDPDRDVAFEAMRLMDFIRWPRDLPAGDSRY